ncbi:inorganic diphosphatase [Sphingomonas nostoxanthinifaciens]|uniref:inorganic diphosphatase n=1 Tax=Sphingomonas nostoxanthinifaciens TaxID=2872652 RepID=UPI001CC1C24C|nr:inorganic diphosphatase [Sphingomonas nostoxanthinifaciens]UAK25233.1 inorganic diphosphatase [Sphingomonas nostoxanthinifaciens]
MANLAQIDPRLDDVEQTCRVVIETPKGSRSKYTYNPELEALELAGLLPAGMSFPLDFDFIPGTLAEDGDPLDILVIGDEPSAPGCVVMVKLLGVIEAEQTERGVTVRNDRLVARTSLSINYRDAASIDDLGQPFVEHLGRFFVNFNELKGKRFEVIGSGDAWRAIDLLRRART